MAATSSLNQIAGGGLTEQAKPYRQRSSINGIFTALRDRFGISAIDARSRLQRLLRKENTPLQDHATVVKRLARIAYSNLPETQQQHYILDDFHPIPQQYRPAPSAPGKRGHHYRSGTSGRTSLPPGPATLPSNTDLPTSDHKAKSPEQGSYHQRLSSLETEVDRLMTMLKWAMTILARTKPMATPRKASRPTT